MASLTQWAWIEQTLEIVKDREVWHAAGRGVAKSQTQLSNWTTNNNSKSWAWKRNQYSARVQVHSRQSGQHVQRSWGRNKVGRFAEKQRAVKQVRVGNGKSPKRWARLTSDLIWPWARLQVHLRISHRGQDVISKYVDVNFSLLACLCAKSLQSCLTRCNRMDSRPPGSPGHGILQGKMLQCFVMSHMTWSVFCSAIHHMKGCHVFLQRTFLTQQLNPCLLNCRQATGEAHQPANF